jgi:hypothetical protein
MLEPPTGPAAVTAPIRVSSNSSQFIETSNTLAWAIAQCLGRSPIAPRTESLASGVVPPQELKECGLSLGTKLCSRKRGNYTTKSVEPHGYEISVYRPRWFEGSVIYFWCL